MKKLIIMAMATLLGVSLMGQKREIVDLINQKGAIEPPTRVIIPARI